MINQITITGTNQPSLEFNSEIRLVVYKAGQRPLESIAKGKINCRKNGRASPIRLNPLSPKSNLKKRTCSPYQKDCLYPNSFGRSEAKNSPKTQVRIHPSKGKSRKLEIKRTIPTKKSNLREGSNKKIDTSPSQAKLCLKTIANRSNSQKTDANSSSGTNFPHEAIIFVLILTKTVGKFITIHILAAAEN